MRESIFAEIFAVRPCKCCNTPYRPARGCFDSGGYMCACSGLKLCSACGKCRGVETSDELWWSGHCRCRQAEKQRVADEIQQNVREGW
jgi:hypothetical protein